MHWAISSKGTYHFKLNLQLLATNKSKKKNFSLYSVNNKHFKTNSSHGEKNSEHLKRNSSHRENPLTAHSAAAWVLSSLCKAYLVNSLLISGRKWNKFHKTFLLKAKYWVPNDAKTDNWSKNLFPLSMASWLWTLPLIHYC